MFKENGKQKEKLILRIRKKKLNFLVHIIRKESLETLIRIGYTEVMAVT